MRKEATGCWSLSDRHRPRLKTRSIIQKFVCLGWQVKPHAKDKKTTHAEGLGMVFLKVINTDISKVVYTSVLDHH